MNPTFTGAVVLLLMFVVAMLGCGVLGVAIERFAYRPLRDAPRIAPLISALGVSFFIAYSMQLMFGAALKNRADVIKQVRKVVIKNWILGGTFRFSTKTNDPLNGKFTIFQIQSDGKYKVVN